MRIEFSVIQASFVEETILSLLNVLGTLVENRLISGLYSFQRSLTLGLYYTVFILFIYLFIFIKVACSIEIRKCEFSNFVLF